MSKLPPFTGNGAEPTAAMLKPFRKNIQQDMLFEKFPMGHDSTLSYTRAAKWYRMLPPDDGHTQYFLSKHVDKNGDKKISLDEMARLRYWTDQLGNKDGTVSGEEIQNAALLGGQHFLLNEGHRLGLPSTVLTDIEDRIATNNYTVPRKKLEKTFDLTNSNQAPEVRPIKVNEAISQYRSYGRIQGLSTGQKDTVRKEALKAFSGLGQLPFIEKSGSDTVDVNAVPTKISTADGVHYVEGAKAKIALNFKTGETSPFRITDEILASLSNPRGYTSDGSEIQKEMQGKAEKVLTSPENRNLFTKIRNDALNILEDPNRFQTSISDTVEAFRKGYGLKQSPQISFLKSRDPSQTILGSAHPDNKLSFYRGEFIRAKNEFIKTHNLDLNNPGHRTRVANHVFGQMMDTVGHEVAHLDQFARIFNGMPRGEQPHGPRLLDYTRNLTAYNSLREEEYLLGVVHKKPGDAWYLRQPLEADAHAIGQYINKRAIELYGRWLPSVDRRDRD